jgi:glucokinase
MILAGDVGGTKVALALFEERDTGLALRQQQSFASADFDTLESVVAEFMAAHGDVTLRASCLGVAGVVRDGQAHATNLPWQVSEASLAKVCGTPRVRLLNDLEATARGMLLLAPDELAVLQPGSGDRRANIAVIAAGTGLGEAMLFWDGSQHHPVASEGGHADFAARSEREIRLYRFLREQHGPHVSYERVLSGPGLLGIYRFLRAESGVAEPQWLTVRLTEADGPAAVSDAALAHQDAVCAEALELFVEVYGAEAGNLALRCLAHGGVFVGGGIAAKILPALQTGSFIRALRNKGAFEPLLAGIEVSVAKSDRAPLLGCAHYAQRL